MSSVLVRPPARDALEGLDDAIAAVRLAASDATDAASTEAMVAALRAADALTATAVGIAGRLAGSGGVERATGLSTELVLSLAAGRTRTEARLMAEAAATLGAMPATGAAFARGALSWGQVRSIVAAVRPLTAADRASVDRLVDAELARAPGAEPDHILGLVDDQVAHLRSDLALAREDRRWERSFLSIQPRLGGDGGSIYGEADAEAFATIVEAIDAAAARPLAADLHEVPSRARQRLDGLVAVCEASLAGGASQGRPRPRFLATVDVSRFQTDGFSEAARILWRVGGRPGRITPLGTEVLACDAEIVPVIFDGGRPIGVGDPAPTVPAKVRTALVARDGGCRFPGCGAPASWADSHHILPRSAGGTNRLGNLVLLCRRCHRRVHRHRWRITPNEDGTITFAHRGVAYTSCRRTRTPSRE